MTENHPTPRLFISMAMLVCVLSIVCVVVSWIESPTPWSIQLALIAVAAGALELFASKLPVMSVSLTYPLMMCGIVLGGPSACSTVAIASGIVITWLERERPISIVCFNFGQTVLVGCLAGWSYSLLGGRPLASGTATFDLLTTASFPDVLYGMFAAAIVACIVNLVLVSLGISTYTHSPFRSVFSSSVGFIPTQIALAFVGFLMAQVLAISILAFPLFAFPLVFAQQLYKRYIGMKNAYVDTVRSFIGALEAKDPYTRGHSERVADYSAKIGRQMNLDPKRQERLEYAALLHDIGKLAVPSQVLTKPSRLNDEEMHYIHQHPGRGAEMIARIPHFSDLAELVGKHHERYDGGGYPSSITAADIPLIARILTVADSYDAMTSSRSYRPALSHEVAISELKKCEGSQFDPDVVEAFLAAGIAASDAVKVVSNPAQPTTELVGETT
ncbi:MAG: HD-GYP domain-containing protein [Coriobacteriia bacterium]